MATYSPDVTWRINKATDRMVSEMLAGSGLNSNGVDNLLIDVKTFLDANFVNYKDGSGNYTPIHVRQAVTTLLSRGK